MLFTRLMLLEPDKNLALGSIVTATRCFMKVCAHRASTTVGINRNGNTKRQLWFGFYISTIR
jgi:hypothetical protein